MYRLVYKSAVRPLFIFRNQMPCLLPNAPKTPTKLIESVVNLTEQRDELTLLRSLLEAIQEMLPGVQAALIWLVPGTERGQWVEDAGCPLPKPMFRMTDWLLDETASLIGRSADEGNSNGMANAT